MEDVKILPRFAVIADGWAMCPRCWKKLARVDEGARSHGVRCYCKGCKGEYEVNTESL